MFNDDENFENDGIESAEELENLSEAEYKAFINQGLKRDSTPPGYSHHNREKKYSEADYENSHLTDNQIDPYYEFARITAQGRAQRRREDENAQRISNLYRRDRYGTDDEIADGNKLMLVYVLGIIVGLAAARLFEFDAAGYFICAALGMLGSGFIKSHRFDGASPMQALIKNFLITALVVIIVGAVYLFCR